MYLRTAFKSTGSIVIRSRAGNRIVLTKNGFIFCAFLFDTGVHSYKLPLYTALLRQNRASYKRILLTNLSAKQINHSNTTNIMLIKIGYQQCDGQAPPREIHTL